MSCNWLQLETDCMACLLQVLGRTPFGGDFYVIGKTPAAAYSAASNSVTSGLFQGNYDVASYTPRLLDYGSVYASKSFRLDDGRQLMMSWIFETSVGCDQMCSSGTPFTNASVSILLRHQHAWRQHSWATCMFSALDQQDLSKLERVSRQTTGDGSLEPLLDVTKCATFDNPFTNESVSTSAEQLQVCCIIEISAGCDQGCSSGTDFIIASLAICCDAHFFVQCQANIWSLWHDRLCTRS